MNIIRKTIKQLVSVMTVTFLSINISLADDSMNDKPLDFEEIYNINKLLSVFIVKECQNNSNFSNCLKKYSDNIDKSLEITSYTKGRYFFDYCYKEYVYKPINNLGEVYINDYLGCINKSKKTLSLNTAYKDFNYFFINEDFVNDNVFYFCNRINFFDNGRINECIKEQKKQSNYFKKLFYESKNKDSYIRNCLEIELKSDYIDFISLNNCVYKK